MLRSFPLHKEQKEEEKEGRVLLKSDFLKAATTPSGSKTGKNESLVQSRFREWKQGSHSSRLTKVKKGPRVIGRVETTCRIFTNSGQFSETLFFFLLLFLLVSPFFVAEGPQQDARMPRGFFFFIYFITPTRFDSRILMDQNHNGIKNMKKIIDYCGLHPLAYSWMLNIKYCGHLGSTFGSTKFLKVRYTKHME